MSIIIDAIRERLLAYMPKQDVDGLLEIVGKRGFDAATAIYAERAREAKRQWQDIAGRTYGVKVASDWRPDGWLADMDAMTTQQAEEAVTGAREALAALHQVQAVTEAEAQQAAEAKAALPGLQAALQSLFRQDAGDSCRTGRAAAYCRRGCGQGCRTRSSQAAEVLVRVKDSKLSCPHCQRAVVMGSDGVLEQYDEEAASLDREQAAGVVSEIEIILAKLAREHEALQESAQGYQSRLREADTELGEAKTALAVAEKLAGKADAEVDTADRRADLMQAEQAVDDAKRVSTMVSAEARAAELSETIARYAQIVLAIGPQGVRAKMMEAGLKHLNAGLKVIAMQAIWPLAEVTERGTVTWDKRPIQLCSASEQWRAQAAIQLTLAAMTGSRAVVLDRADLLDTNNRCGLVRAVNRVSGKTGIAVLLCSTGAANGDAPWKQVTIEGGETR